MKLCHPPFQNPVYGPGSVIPIGCFMYTIQLKGNLWNVLYKTLTRYIYIPSQWLIIFYKKVRFIKKTCCVAQTIPTRSPTQAST